MQRVFDSSDMALIPANHAPVQAPAQSRQPERQQEPPRPRRCEACGTDGVVNSAGQFISRDWLRAAELGENNRILATLLEPQKWTPEMRAAWERAMPDVAAAFAALRTFL